MKFMVIGDERDKERDAPVCALQKLGLFHEIDIETVDSVSVFFKLLKQGVIQDEIVFATIDIWLQGWSKNPEKGVQTSFPGEEKLESVIERFENFTKRKREQGDSRYYAWHNIDLQRLRRGAIRERQLAEMEETVSELCYEFGGVALAIWLRVRFPKIRLAFVSSFAEDEMGELARCLAKEEGFKVYHKATASFELQHEFRMAFGDMIPLQARILDDVALGDELQRVLDAKSIQITSEPGTADIILVSAHTALKGYLEEQPPIPNTNLHLPLFIYLNSIKDSTQLFNKMLAGQLPFKWRGPIRMFYSDLAPSDIYWSEINQDAKNRALELYQLIKQFVTSVHNPPETFEEELLALLPFGVLFEQQTSMWSPTSVAPHYYLSEQGVQVLEECLRCELNRMLEPSTIQLEGKLVNLMIVGDSHSGKSAVARLIGNIIKRRSQKDLEIRLLPPLCGDPTLFRQEAFGDYLPRTSTASTGKAPLSPGSLFILPEAGKLDSVSFTLLLEFLSSRLTSPVGSKPDGVSDNVPAGVILCSREYTPKTQGDGNPVLPPERQELQNRITHHFRTFGLSLDFRAILAAIYVYLHQIQSDIGKSVTVALSLKTLAALALADYSDGHFRKLKRCLDSCFRAVGPPDRNQLVITFTDLPKKIINNFNVSAELSHFSEQFKANTGSHPDKVMVTTSRLSQRELARLSWFHEWQPGYLVLTKPEQFRTSSLSRLNSLKKDLNKSEEILSILKKIVESPPKPLLAAFADDFDSQTGLPLFEYEYTHNVDKKSKYGKKEQIEPAILTLRIIHEIAGELLQQVIKDLNYQEGQDELRRKIGCGHRLRKWPKRNCTNDIDAPAKAARYIRECVQSSPLFIQMTQEFRKNPDKLKAFYGVSNPLGELFDEGESQTAWKKVSLSFVPPTPIFKNII